MANAQEFDLRNSLPSEFLSRHGDSLVVLHPGDRWLAIGKASQPRPHVISHCIAYHTSGPRDGLPQPVAPPQNPLALSQAAAACQQAAAALKLDALLAETLAQGRRNVETLTDSAQSSAAQLTNCVESVDVEGVAKYRRSIIGDEVLGIWHEEPYSTVWPLAHEVISGRSGRSVIQIKDDLFNIWKWALTSKAGLSSSDIRKMSVVLVVSPFMHMSTVRLLVDVLLVHVGFQSVVVHLETAAAMFGQGVSQACVVFLGHESGWVGCVDDGVLAAHSRITLPYGTQHVRATLMRLMKEHCQWPPEEQFNINEHIVDRTAFEQLSSQCLFLPVDGEQCVVEQQVLQTPIPELNMWSSDKTAQTYRVNLGPLPCLAATSYFLTPMMFRQQHSIHSALMQRPASHNYWSFLVDSSSPTEVVLQLLTHRSQDGMNPSAIISGPYNYMPYMPLGPFHPPNVWPPLALDAAVVSSICAAGGRPEQRQRLLSSVLLVGPGAAGIRGLGQFLERRMLAILQAMQQQVDLVAVLEPRLPPLGLIWQGGVLLGTLDSREYWVKREEWVDGGIHLGTGMKSSRADSLHAKLFWYCKAQQGA